VSSFFYYSVLVVMSSLLFQYFKACCYVVVTRSLVRVCTVFILIDTWFVLLDILSQRMSVACCLSTVFWDSLVSSYFRHFAQMASFILASLTFATCRFLAKINTTICSGMSLYKQRQVRWWRQLVMSTKYTCRTEACIYGEDWQNVRSKQCYRYHCYKNLPIRDW